MIYSRYLAALLEASGLMALFPIKLGLRTHERTSRLKVMGFCLNYCGFPMLQKVILLNGYSII